MTITITEKEYEAILFAVDQVGTAVEAAGDEYADSASKISDSLWSIIYKYRKAREKANEFQRVRMFVAEKNRNRGLRPRDIDAFTRKVIKKMREDK